MDVLLANPRGFCAGVERAIAIVERALEKFGAPIYVRHEVVHNRFVVDGLKAKGAVFVEELDEVPAGATVIFSAHGVPKAVREEADKRGLRVFDATCPLVTKVHLEVERHCKQGREIVMIGHKGHPEVEGTMGQAPCGMHLVECVGDVAKLTVKNPAAACLRHPDDLVDGRCGGDRHCAQGAFPRHRWAEEGRHLLCDTEPAGCGEGTGRDGSILSSSSARRTVRTPIACAKWRRISAFPHVWSTAATTSTRLACRKSLRWCDGGRLGSRSAGRGCGRPLECAGGTNGTAAGWCGRECQLPFT